MRIRGAAAAACIVMAAILLAGGLISAVSSPAGPGAVAPLAAATKGQGKHKTVAKQDTHPQRQNGQKAQKGRKHAKHAPKALDAASISTRNADALDCGDLIEVKVGGRIYCTHGNDPPIISGAPEARSAVTTAAAPPGPLCLGNGTSGPRIQLVYVHSTDRPDRYDELLPTFRRLAAEMDLIFDQSARKTGGSLRVRFVTDGNCQVDIVDLGASPNAVSGFGSLIQRLSEGGYDRLDRKYLMLVDDDAFCGVGSYAGGRGADDPDTHSHDFTGYARVDVPCWDAGSMAHEISHTMGAVQYSAPHTSLGGHCIDEWDVMCYSDAPFHPKMKFLCKDGLGDFRLDCNNDDYFAANPARGSYLARHWNEANSMYLTPGNGETCIDAQFEPDDAYWYDYWGPPMRHFKIGTSEAHAFCQESGDTDWALFEAKRGKTYQVETKDLAPGVDTQLILYRGFTEEGWSGMEQTASNDDRAEDDPSSVITFTAPADVSYLVGVSDASGEAGFDRTYTLSIKTTPSSGHAAISLSPTTAKPGESFTATVRDLAPSASVAFWWHRKSELTHLGDRTANAEGVATARFAVPRDAGAFVYQVEAVANDGSAPAANLKVAAGTDKPTGKGNKPKHKRRHGH